MQKLLLNSILVATIAIPAMCARDRNPRRGLRRAIFYTAAFDLAYLVGVLFIYPRLH
jgi:hypothetical protein